MSTPTPGAPRRYRDASSDDGWGPSTSVQSGSTNYGAPVYGEPTSADGPGYSGYEGAGRHSTSVYPAAGARNPAVPPATGALPPELDPRRGRRRADASRGVAGLPDAGGLDAPGRSGRPERGLPGWGALIVLLVIAGIGGIIDTISGASVRGGFNIGIVVASVVAILVVRCSGMFPIVVAPPIVYAAAALGRLYVSGHSKAQVIDAASNWLVYGFPALAGATAAVLIIAGIRLIARR